MGGFRPWVKVEAISSLVGCWLSTEWEFIAGTPPGTARLKADTSGGTTARPQSPDGDVSSWCFPTAASFPVIVLTAPRKCWVGPRTEASSQGTQVVKGVVKPTCFGVLCCMPSTWMRVLGLNSVFGRCWEWDQMFRSRSLFISPLISSLFDDISTY